ncbi:MAG TPA: AAA family ATPase, partial [Candidatus Limnocylindrales bacterium]
MRDQRAADDVRADEAPGRLLELAVTNVALIDRLRLRLEPGLNVLTGETGAGKSLVIDALGLAIGARADTSIVRHGAETARVEAVFDRSPEPLIAVREVGAAGRSTARLDDETVTSGRLAAAVAPLIEIHGQHDQGRLVDAGHQLELLDAFGALADLRHAVAAAVAAWRENRDALSALVVDPREVERRLELLRHEIDEIAAARPQEGEIDGLKGRLEASRHGEAIARGAGSIRAALDGEGSGARDAVAAAIQE